MGDGGTKTQGTGAKTLAAMLLQAVESYSGDEALRYHDGDDWTELSYEELGKAAREIAGGLIAAGIEAGDKVAIFANTRSEWTLADLGVVLAGAVAVPIYQTSSVEEAKHVLEDSEAKLVFCENDELLKTAKEAASDLEFVVFEGDGATTLDQLREKGADSESEVDERAEGIDPDDVFTIVY